MNKFWERLTHEQVAVHVETIEQGISVIQAFKGNVESTDEDFQRCYFDDYRDDTGIIFDCGDGDWDYYNVHCLKDEGYKILSYDDFMREHVLEDIEGKLVVLVGCSATGKDTVQNELVNNGIAKPVVSHTSRPIRNGEVEGVNYYYIEKLQAQLMLREDEFIEHRTYETIDSEGNKNTWYYGISKSEINNLDFNHHNYVVVVDFQGLRLLEEYMTSQGLRDKMVSVFIKASSQTRLKRSLDREGNMTEGQVAEVIRRFLDDKEKVEPAISYCDIVLTNEKGQDLNRCVKAIEVIISV